jgi:hypothetical protein
MSNRKARRQHKAQSSKAKYSLKDVQVALSIAIEMKKHTRGHLFSKVQKDTCVFCGATMKTKKQCQYWVLTLFDRMQTALINPTFFTNENIQALYLQHGEEYQNIKLPLNIALKKKINNEPTA